MPGASAARCAPGGGPSPFPGGLGHREAQHLPRGHTAAQLGSPPGGIWRLGLRRGPLQGPPETRTHTPPAEQPPRLRPQDHSSHASSGRWRVRAPAGCRRPGSRRPRARTGTGALWWTLRAEAGSAVSRGSQPGGGDSDRGPLLAGRRDLAPRFFPTERKHMGSEADLL